MTASPPFNSGPCSAGARNPRPPFVSAFRVAGGEPFIASLRGRCRGGIQTVRPGPLFHFSFHGADHA